MNVLVACEESQAVCTAFREKGHEAFSCDVQHCAIYNHMEWHVVERAEILIRGHCHFQTVDGVFHSVEQWDLIIAHPPCTYLSAAGAVRLYDSSHRIKDRARYEKGMEARRFFMLFLQADCPRVCVENPIPMKIFGLPPYTQIIEPFFFGEPWRKKTALWLRGLPALHATNPTTPTGLWVGASGSKRQTYKGKKDGIYLNTKRDPKIRARTFQGVAQAMAEQWG